ncbi:hypothetical protein GQ457_09G002470 [Hibiscus cannabinus]
MPVQVYLNRYCNKYDELIVNPNEDTATDMTILYCHEPWNMYLPVGSIEICPNGTKESTKNSKCQRRFAQTGREFTPEETSVVDFPQK